MKFLYPLSLIHWIPGKFLVVWCSFQFVFYVWNGIWCVLTAGHWDSIRESDFPYSTSSLRDYLPCLGLGLRLKGKTPETVQKIHESRFVLLSSSIFYYYEKNSDSVSLKYKCCFNFFTELCGFPGDGGCPPDLHLFLYPGTFTLFFIPSFVSWLLQVIQSIFFS